jgi:hypothetical protein
VKGGSEIKMSAGTVYIDDIVQLASGTSAAAAQDTDPAPEVKTKEEVRPSRFDDAAAEAPSGDIASQAKGAEQPASAQSAAAGPSAPPDRHPPLVTKLSGPQ